MANTTITPSTGSILLASAAASLILTLTPAIPTWEVQQRQVTVTWANTPQLYVGGASPVVSYRNVSFQASGTWGSGGSIKLQGSNDGVTWNDLSPVALTSAGFFAALGAREAPKYFRPNCTAGDATTSISVTAWFS